MRAIAILALLLLGLGSLVLCLPLERLCPVDQFEYNGIRVNAIHRVQINVTLEPVSHFAINHSNICLNFLWDRWKSKSNIEEFEDDYNRLLIPVYSERFLNAEDLNSSALANVIDHIHKRNRFIENRVLATHSPGGPFWKCVKAKLSASMRRAIELIRQLASLHDQQLPQTDKLGLNLGKTAIFKKFRAELDRIANEMTCSQTMAFQFDLLKDVYKKRIVRMGKFVFNKKSKIFFDLDSSGTIGIELLFPFEDTELPFGNVTSEYFDVANNCVSLADLPEFFVAQRSIVVNAPTTQTSDQPTEKTTPASMA